MLPPTPIIIIFSTTPTSVNTEDGLKLPSNDPLRLTHIIQICGPFGPVSSVRLGNLFSLFLPIQLDFVLGFFIHFRVGWVFISFSLFYILLSFFMAIFITCGIHFNSSCRVDLGSFLYRKYYEFICLHMANRYRSEYVFLVLFIY